MKQKCRALSVLLGVVLWFGVVNNVYAETSVNTDVPSYEQNTSKVNGIIN